MTEGQWVRVVRNDKWVGRVGVLTSCDGVDALWWVVVFPPDDEEGRYMDSRWFHENHLEPWYNPTDPT
jgi:hypothetical protein